MNIDRYNELAGLHNAGITLPYGATEELLDFVRFTLTTPAVAEEAPAPAKKPSKAKAAAAE